MAPCKCKEKTPETSQVPCTEPEESFRQAYLRISQEKVQIAAERNDLKSRFDTLGEQAKQAVLALNNLLKKRDDETEKLLTFLQQRAPHVLDEFVKREGPLHFAPKVSA